MSANISHSIKHRENANDVFITPLPLAKKAIDMCVDSMGIGLGHTWFDPFKNSGSYYNQYPEGERKLYTEILEGRDFFKFDGNVDIICSNPPYSLLDKVIEKSIELEPSVINYLIGVGNLTARRIEMLENAGYGLTKLHMCKVFDWYGMSYIVQFELGGDSIMSYDRQVWKQEKPVIKIKPKKKSK